MTQVTLADQTDKHNELVFEREWLLGPSEGLLHCSGNLLFLEHTLAVAGDPQTRPPSQCSPNPNRSRLHREAALSQPSSPALPITRWWRWLMRQVVRAHCGAPVLQRQLRVPDLARDGVLLSNTWGDRSRDARINEAFVLREIEAGARLGVNVVQIDDGWQKGRTKNSAGPRGVWGGWWAADPQFWNPDPQRFPNGLKPLVDAARARDLKIGLWFAPDSSKEAVNWRRDADRILELHHDLGIDYFKIDALKTPTAIAAENQHRLFDRVMRESQGRVVFDLDVTADVRPGYFGLPEIGPIFVENRYTDSRNYWPHHTLRNLWKLAQYIDPLRLRIEFLNNTRNANQYNKDPLAPDRYHPDTLFAMTMSANPLGWFEVSNLPKGFVTAVAPLVAQWKSERVRLQAGTIIPIGRPPDGVVWTGFASISASQPGGSILLFRELNENAEFSLDLRKLFSSNLTATVLAGQGSAELKDDCLKVRIPAPLDFLWVRLDAENPSAGVSSIKAMYRQ